MHPELVISRSPSTFQKGQCNYLIFMGDYLYFNSRITKAQEEELACSADQWNTKEQSQMSWIPIKYPPDNTLANTIN